MIRKAIAILAVSTLILAVPGPSFYAAWAEGAAEGERPVVALPPVLFVHPNASRQVLEPEVAKLVKSPVPQAVFERLASLLKHRPVAVVGLGDRVRSDRRALQLWRAL